MKKMQKMFLVLFMVFALSGTAFAQYGDNVGGQQIQGTMGDNNTVSPTYTDSSSGKTIYGPGSGSVGGSLIGGEGGAGGKGGSAVGISGDVTISPIIKPEINIGNSGFLGGDTFSPKAIIEEDAIKNVNINKPEMTNIQGQKQQQQQDQSQSSVNTISPVITANPTNANTQAQNNAQTIAPVQEINIAAPDLSNQRVVVGGAPNLVGAGELNFVSPNERDVQTLLPKFGCGIIAPLKEEDCIVDVIWQSNDIKFKHLYKEVLKGLRSDEVMKLSSVSVRYQIREAASAKTWTTGGSVGANGVGALGSGVAGVAGGILPQVGRSKSSNLYTIIFVQIQQFK